MMVAIYRFVLSVLVIAMSFCAIAATTYTLRVIPLGSPDEEQSLAVYSHQHFSIAVDRFILRDEIAGHTTQSQIAKYKYLLEVLEGTPAEESIVLTDEMLPRRIDLHVLLIDLLEASRAYVRDDRTSEYLETVQGGKYYTKSGRVGGSGGRVFKTLDGEIIIVLEEIEVM